LWRVTPAEPPFNQAYVLGLTVSPTDPDAIVAGIEFGALLRSDDGGLPDPLPYMPYSLITDVDNTGHVYAGISNGDIWHSRDFGDSWIRLDLNVGGIHRQMIGF
jgi:hypothetical protein